MKNFSKLSLGLFMLSMAGSAQASWYLGFSLGGESAKKSNFSDAVTSQGFEAPKGGALVQNTVFGLQFDNGARLAVTASNTAMYGDDNGNEGAAVGNRRGGLLFQYDFNPESFHHFVAGGALGGGDAALIMFTDKKHDGVFSERYVYVEPVLAYEYGGQSIRFTWQISSVLPFARDTDSKGDKLGASELIDINVSSTVGLLVYF